jgi:hypothetical protein
VARRFPSFVCSIGYAITAKKFTKCILLSAAAIRLAMSGVAYGNYRDTDLKDWPDITARCFDELYSHYADEKNKPPPTTFLPIDRYADALSAICDRTARGRIVLYRTNGRNQESCNAPHNHVTYASCLMAAA